MKKNGYYMYNLKGLGQMQIEIIANEQQLLSKQTISEDFLIKHKDTDMQTFLYAIYIENKDNDIICDIVGEYLENQPNISKQQIVNEINTKYLSHVNKHTTSSDTYFHEGDCIYVAINQQNNENNPLFYMNVTMKKYEGKLMAFIEDNRTNPEYGHKGLQTLGFSFLEAYLLENHITLEGLEPDQTLGGNDFDVTDAYKKHGFTQEPDDNLWIKDVTSKEILTDENTIIVGKYPTNFDNIVNEM